MSAINALPIACHSISIHAYFYPLVSLTLLCSTFTAIRQEIRDIEEGIMDKTNNPLKVWIDTVRASEAGDRGWKATVIWAGIKGDLCLPEKLPN